MVVKKEAVRRTAGRVTKPVFKTARPSSLQVAGLTKAKKPLVSTKDFLHQALGISWGKKPTKTQIQQIMGKPYGIEALKIAGIEAQKGKKKGGGRGKGTTPQEEMKQILYGVREPGEMAAPGLLRAYEKGMLGGLPYGYKTASSRKKKLIDRYLYTSTKKYLK